MNQVVKMPIRNTLNNNRAAQPSITGIALSLTAGRPKERPMTAFVKIAAFAAMTVMAVPAQAESPFASLAYLPQISPSAFPVNLPTTKDLVGPITAQLAAIPAPAAGADNLGFTLQEGDGNA